MEKSNRLNKVDENIHELYKAGYEKHICWFIEKWIVKKYRNEHNRHVVHTYLIRAQEGKGEKKKKNGVEATCNEMIFQSWWKKLSHRFETCYIQTSTG